MSNLDSLPTTYSAENAEKKWYQIWKDGKYFKPKMGKANESYCIIMPPPNVTGILHMGHALDVTTQDTLTRFKRMKGYETLWLPGMDHAGIATQNVVEKLVYKEEGKTIHDFSREDFLKKIWSWKEEYGGKIATQQESLGASCDWDYSIFTMDDHPNKAVKKFFVQMYNEGLIYQSDYIVNWDPELQSAISDAEVEHKEVKGAFYHLLYKIKETGETVEIATTRPETMLGDTAIAVHPKDERFKHLIGKTAIVPLCEREVPVIGDSYVDMEKGTGCLKVTPGHDFNDFDIGKRHNLPIITILNKDGTLNDLGLEWKGLTCKKARKLIVQRLEENGVLKETKEHIHQVGHGDRSKAVIEPLVSKQWFLNVESMAADAVKKVEDESTKFYPKGWENTYFSWLREPKNWCISRQLIWGHQIPVFYCNECNHQWASEENEKNCKKCNSKDIYQDPDVLDTWFSSGLWPMSTLGWPNEELMKEKGFDRFFPTSVLITGFDIIFFWVARMMMMSLKTLNKIPFHHVYIHAIVRDKQGRKLSKSLGNGIDPMEMIESYGADAIRFTLAAGSGYNRGLNLDPERIAGFRNFINKVWNAFRFIAPSLSLANNKLPNSDKLHHHERWIISELNSISKSMNESIEVYRFDDSCSDIYQFVYDRFCSWFIEVSKVPLNEGSEEEKIQRATVLKYCFRKIVALLHPFTPFITEELWSYLKEENEDLLISQEYPEYDKELSFQDDQEKMSKFIDVITSIRNLRSSVNMKPKEEIKVSLFTDDTKLQSYFLDNKDSFLGLAKVKELTVLNKSEVRPTKSVMLATTHTEVFLPLEGVIDLNDQIKRLEKDLLKTQKEFDKNQKKLSNEKFMQNAPKEVLEEVNIKSKELEEKINSINENLKNFKS